MMKQDYSLITHTLPTSLLYEGNVAHMDTRVCRVLQCFLLSEDGTVPVGMRITAIVEAMVSNHSDFSPAQYPGLYEKLCDFMAGYPSGGSRGKKAQKLLSYEQDHALIVSAFRQAYGIDLKTLKMMHWWEFLALMAGIPDDTRLSGVINIRGMEMSPNDTPEQRQAKIKAKTAVAIRPKRKAVADEMEGEDIISQALSKEG